MNNKIRYELGIDQKEIIVDRLMEIINKKTGTQAILLMDEKKLTDYYQNICVKHLIGRILTSSVEYSKMTNNELIENNLTESQVERILSILEEE